MKPDITTSLGRIQLSSPLVAASGTVGSVWEFARVADPGCYGAMVAKSVSGDPWKGNTPPRMAPAGVGMLNSIGIQNPGIDEWVRQTAPRLRSIDCPVWGSAVGKTPDEFARVATGLEQAGVGAIEVNLSCPNLEGKMFSLDPAAAAAVIDRVRSAVEVPIGAKLTPNAQDIVAVATACRDAGVDWVTLTNTVWGARIDIETRAPVISAVIGGYSGPPLKPISLRCVIEVARALPELPILGCGGVVSGTDVVEYLMAGASAVALGTIHFAEPAAASRILDELVDWCQAHGVTELSTLCRAGLGDR